MQKERYRRASHTVANLDHFLCRTKCSCEVLKDDAALRPVQRGESSAPLYTCCVSLLSTQPTILALGPMLSVGCVE